MVGEPRRHVRSTRATAGAIERCEQAIAQREPRRSVARTSPRCRGVARKVVFEIGAAQLEMLAQLGIGRAKQEVEHPVAEQHDLHLQRNRVGLERDRVRQADEASDVLDRDLAAPQRALERRPTERLHQQAARVDEEIASVRAVQRAGLDEQEIGDEHAMGGDIIDAADQIAERRVQFLDQRRADRAVLEIRTFAS